MISNEHYAEPLQVGSKLDENGGEFPSKSDNPNLVEQLDKLREIRAERIKMNRAALRREVVNACTLGVSLMSDEPMWHAFCAADWSGISNPPQLGEQKKAVFFAIKYMCGPGKEAQKAASFYFCAVDPFVRDGILGDDLLSVIDYHKGLKSLNDQRRALAKSPYKRAIAASTKAEAVSEKERRQNLVGEENGTISPDTRRSLERWDNEHPTKYVFEVSFPYHPSDIIQARPSQRYLILAKITEIGEKSVMKIEQYQKSKPKRRIGHRFA
jgi:hypothetical protein